MGWLIVGGTLELELLAQVPTPQNLLLDQRLAFDSDRLPKCAILNQEGYT